jgi:hypothetical protein
MDGNAGFAAPVVHTVREYLVTGSFGNVSGNVTGFFSYCTGFWGFFKDEMSISGRHRLFFQVICKDQTWERSHGFFKK